MPDREKYIEILSKTVKTVKEYNEDTPIKISLECVEDILELLKEQEDLGTELTNAVELIHKKNERIEKLMKEQEAVEPRRDANCVRMFRCGVCGEYVGFIDSDPGDPNEQDNYCRNCGRKVMWK